MITKPSLYTDPESTALIAPDVLRTFETDRQVEVMREWFNARYEDPANSIPYEGGYIYLGNGPFDARDELEDEFSDVVSSESIDALVSELNNYGYEWAYTESYQHELGFFDDNYEVDAALDMEIPIDAVYQRIDKIKQLLAATKSMDSSLHEFQYMMIFVFCITTLETFLSDTLIKSVIEDESLKKKYLKSLNKNIPLADLHDLHNAEDIKRYLDESLKREHGKNTFHNIIKAKRFYKSIFGLDIAEKIDCLDESIIKRHDFVHRAGKDKEGNDVNTNITEISCLINRIGELCRFVDREIGYRCVPMSSEF